MSIPSQRISCQDPDQLPLFREHDFYHDARRHGFFALCHKAGGKLHQRSYPLQLMPEVLRAVDRSRDTYMSQAEFLKYNRLLINLARIGVLFVDIDFHTTEWRHHTPEQIAWLIKDECLQSGFPEPSAIISSGRGLYLKWFLNTAVPARALPRWNAVQRTIVDRFAHYGADPRAKDASRILRLENTVNTKNGEIVKIIDGNMNMYDFDAIAFEILPAPRPDRKPTERILPALTVINGGKSKKIEGLRPLNIATLNWDRFGDLRKLKEIRGGTVPEGHRDTFLFLSCCMLAWAVSPERLYRETAGLAHEFCPEMSTETCRQFASSAYKRALLAQKGERIEFDGKKIDPRYKFRNSTLIDWLGITPDEERQMKTIISAEEAKERDRQRHRKNSDRATYLLNAEQRKTEARLRRAKGETIQQIADALQCSIRSIHNYLSI